MYTFLRDGEFVQITVEPQGQNPVKNGPVKAGERKDPQEKDLPQKKERIKVTGFISRYGDLDSDRGAFLDHFIKQGSIEGHDLTFSTEIVHGVWFEFRGTAQRGNGKTLNDEAYYVLQGTLTEHSEDEQQNHAARSREVVFKSFPQDVSD